MAQELKPAIIHLGASTDLLRPAHMTALRKALPNCRFMRSVPVTGPESVAIARSYEGIADFLLLDSHRQGDVQIGALGITHDWNISRRIVESVQTPVILAGGLGPDNVAAHPAVGRRGRFQDPHGSGRPPSQGFEQGRGLPQGGEGYAHDCPGITGSPTRMTLPA